MSVAVEEAPVRRAGDIAERVPPRRDGTGRFLPGTAAVLGGTAAIAGHASLYGNWLVDDAAITFAYARSLAEGFGPVLQPGAEPVEGFSNPSWLLLLALGRLLGLFDRGTIAGIPDYVLFPKGLALLCCAGILVLCHLVFRRVVRRAWLATALAGAALAALPSFVIWSFSGLENSLYALLVTALASVLVRAVLDGRTLAVPVAVGAGVLAALAALTRPDGLIYVAAYPIVAVWLGRGRWVTVARRAGLSVLTFAVPVTALLVWRLVVFGRWLPTTSVAKRQDLPTPADMMATGDLVAYAGAPAVLAVVALVVTVRARRPWWWPVLAVLFVLAGLAAAAYSVLERDWMAQHRFATPLWVLTVLIGTLVVAEVLRRSRGRRRIVVTATLVVAASGSLTSYAQSAHDFREQVDVPACYVADRLGRGFNAYADILGVERGTLLLPDLGGSAMTSRLRLVDMAGLAEPTIAAFLRDSDKSGLRDYVLDEVKPTFIHSRGPWSAGNGIPSDPRLSRDYHVLYRYPNDDPPNGDWVRKDAVSSQQALAEAREYGQRVLGEVDRRSGGWDTRHCGATLHPGQTEVGTLVLD
ncbi:hypothetical protein B1813_19140 [Saccharomonospora piscinae]|uniref:Glycosyltransferase RgtA/B/C/D-like domain-containing protein n=1 Tax=Saccharomonospora piscinae TaxID=687388 RepID=A0A1V8ZZ43_SACPI|nr:hypothetical protein [Saccharomonospora piscinae]OQO89954.1 hypothetical protein B1813_19140 [Saccharomonospora piscinae]